MLVVAQSQRATEESTRVSAAYDGLIGAYLRQAVDEGCRVEVYNIEMNIKI